ncbi:MAG: hypothetical protein VXZ39_10705, partial [Planctomycetota bacterium]|nr:hypothetical protein [Planctomycetota bacterium]
MSARCRLAKFRTCAIFAPRRATEFLARPLTGSLLRPPSSPGTPRARLARQLRRPPHSAFASTSVLLAEELEDRMAAGWSA